MRIDSGGNVIPALSGVSPKNGPRGAEGPERTSGGAERVTLSPEALALLRGQEGGGAKEAMRLPGEKEQDPAAIPLSSQAKGEEELIPRHVVA